MTRKQSLATLGLKEGADLADIKRAYRRLAFALHPDLNPDVPDASRRFQEVNEAYVLLFQTFAEHSAGQKDGAHSGGTGKSARDAEGGFFSESGRRQDEARKAYARSGEQSFAGSGGKSGAKSHTRAGTRAGGGGKREDVLKDILNDPFARRVFEDIYSHIREPSASGPAAGPSKGEEKKSPQSGGEKKKAAREESPAAPGMLGKVKGWFLKQIDDEQVVRLPRQSLTPGARVRLEIQHGFAEQAQIVEITLPPEFVPGKSMRLKGMGRRIGNLRGDLYVRIESES